MNGSIALRGELIKITPEIAEDWLGKNVRNRSLRRLVVRQYANDMIGGRWHLTGEPIIFDELGRLANGQHRLHACILAAIPFEAYVIIGVGTDAQKYMDSGAKRGAHDAIALDGRTGDAKNVAAVTRGILQFSDGVQRPTQAEVVDFFDQNTDRLEWTTRTARGVRTAIGGRVATYGVALWTLAEVNNEHATAFFNALENGEGLEAGDPRLVLRNQIIKVGSSARNADLSSLRGEVAIIFKAWNAWRTGRRISLLRLTRTEDFPNPH